MLTPLTFHPILKERVWGGRKLDRLYHKQLPPAVPIGESWEISDRPGDVSTIANGALAGKDLHWLIEHRAQELLGSMQVSPGRFPLLIKILDSAEKLSLQVHPPPEIARELGGEPKTEMWFIAQAEPGAELFVGLKRGVTRGEFERKIRAGNVEECIHRIKVKAGDAMFLPSGRLHAIGAGLVIFEIQQNSDTTYRVFDWNRKGLDGKPRTLHIEESLASINFNDFEPPLISGESTGAGPVKVRSLVRDRLFMVELYETATSASLPLPANRLQILGVTGGQIELRDQGSEIQLPAGGFCLIPASAREPVVRITSAASFLRIEPGADSANS